jgi:hypothetical protein
MKGFKKVELKPELDSFFQLESASSTVLATVLFLGIIFSVIAIVHLEYTPEWKNDYEHSHMANMWEDLTELKSKIDTATVLLASYPNSSTSKVTTTTPLHTREPETPFISSTNSIGTFSLNNDRCKMIIILANKNETENATRNATVINCGTITYNSNNKYYTDQTFKYENGALILEQNEKAMMKLYPSIQVSEVSSGNYIFLINAVEIQGAANTISSNLDGSILLKGKSFETLYDNYTSGNEEAFLLTVYTDHPDAWKIYLNETMTGAGLKADKDYALDCIGSNYVTCVFPEKGSSKSLKRLYVGKATIDAELGIGLSSFVESKLNSE